MHKCQDYYEVWPEQQLFRVQRAVSNNVSRRQARRWAEGAPQEQYQAAPVANPTDVLYDQLAKLGQLKDQGILTQEEFDAKKKQLLDL